jgi:hypothetical protein
MLVNRNTLIGAEYFRRNQFEAPIQGAGAKIAVECRLNFPRQHIARIPVNDRPQINKTCP